MSGTFFIVWCAVQVLDALSLEERFKKALPMLTRQIEGLKLLQKTRKTSPDNERVTGFFSPSCFLFFFNKRKKPIYGMGIIHSSVSHLPRCYLCEKVAFSQAVSSIWMKRTRMKMEMTWPFWRGKFTEQTCLNLHSEFA